jgi:hypothetical protein
MSKKSELTNLANLYSSEILKEGFLGRTVKGAAKGAGAGGLIGGTLGALKGGVPGAIAGGMEGAMTGAPIGGVVNAAVGRDDDEEDKTTIKLSLAKNDISNICNSLKRALGAEEDSEEEYADEEEDAPVGRIFSDDETDKILKNVPKTTAQPVASMTPGADAIQSPGGNLKDAIGQGVRTDLGQNPAGVTAVKSAEPWINQAVSDMPDGAMKEIGQSFSAPVSDAAGGGAMDAVKGALAGAGETLKNTNPWLLGGLAAGGGLLAGKMLGGKKNKEEEEDVKAGINSSSSQMSLSPLERQMSTVPNAAQKVSSAIGTSVPGAASTGVATNAAAAMPEVAKTAGAAATKSGLGSAFGDLASKAGEFVKGNPLAAAGIGLGGGLLASKLMDDDEEEGDNSVSKALEYSRTEISNRLSNALNSLEEFDVKKVREVLKNLINDL